MRLDQAKDRSIQKYLDISSKHGKLVQVEARSGERIAIYQTRSQAVVFYNTLPAVCIEKAVCMKTKEALHLKYA